MKIAGLNTLRFFAYLSVFFYHSRPSFIHGRYGVEFFFVLSSFLLTLLALHEIEATGKFNKTNFFVRRCLRIYPLYFLLVLGSFILLPILAGYFNEEPRLPNNKWLYYFFLSNYDDDSTIFPLRFFWSIAVEEQYYLCFLVFSYFFKSRLWIVILLMFLSSVIYFNLSEIFDWRTYNNVLIYFKNFSAGSLLALLWFKNKLPKTKIVYLLTVISIVVLFISEYNLVWFRIGLATLFFCIILIVHHLTTLASFKNNFLFKSLEYLGKYTYGLYMYSGFVLMVFFTIMKESNPYFIILLSFIANVVIAILSYHFYEKYFLRLKSKFRIAANKLQ
jgi:peptidoglycan/LPS O-acetylase OafA/YrhL